MTTPKPLPQTPTMQPHGPTLRAIAARCRNVGGQQMDWLADGLEQEAVSIERDSQGEKSLDLERLGKELYELRDKEAAPAAEHPEYGYTSAAPPPEHGRLEPCPFCGRAAACLVAEDRPPYKYDIECDECRFRMIGNDPDELRVRWNRRAPLTSLPASATGGQALSGERWVALMNFYAVGSPDDLIAAMEAHIVRLQEKVPKTPPIFEGSSRHG